MANIKKFGEETGKSKNFINRVRDFLTPEQVKKNNETAKKYIELVIDDWNKRQDLLKVFIADSDSSCSLTYRISQNPYDLPNTGGMSPHYIEVKLMVIKERFGWPNDISRARFEVHRHDDYKGERPLVGRDMETGDVVEDMEGINKYVYDYINISPHLIKDIVSFFIKEFKSKYPSMDKYYNYMRLFELDKDLARKYREGKEEYYKKKGYL